MYDTLYVQHNLDYIAGYIYFEGRKWLKRLFQDPLGKSGFLNHSHILLFIFTENLQYTRHSVWYWECNERNAQIIQEASLTGLII